MKTIGREKVNLFQSFDYAYDVRNDSIAHIGLIQWV